MPSILWAAALSLSLWVTPASSQEEETIAVNIPENLDPNDGSGWLQIELAVLVDDRESMLASESWPLYPTARYPVRHRRLRDPQAILTLSEQYPETTITQDLEGTITLEVPDPEAIIEAELAAAAAEAAAEAAENYADQTDEQATASTADNAENASDSDELMTLEMLNEPVETGGAGANWLDDYGDLPPVDALDGEADGGIGDGDDIRDPVLPESFVLRPPELLQEGLQRYVRETPDRLAFSGGWLQPPGGANLPIILDNSGDTPNWPQLQGFIQLRTGDGLRLGVNMWWNTDAHYLPDGFHMSGPPAAPVQFLWRDQDTGTPLTAAEVEQRQTRLQELARKRAEGLPLIEYVDPDTGFFRALEPPVREIEDPTPADPWPWQHFLHVEDTRTIPEGYVRYFDHPVLKIIATWRELSWGEVYQLGAEEQERREVEAAVDEAMDTAVPIPQN